MLKIDKVPETEKLIGVSTFFMIDEGEGLEKALNTASEAGFQVLEIVPTIVQGNIGYPETKKSLGFCLDDITSKKMSALKKWASSFSCLTVHSPNLDLNIASHNPGIRKESQRQYIQCIDFAKELGARSVTFHPGITNRGEFFGDDDFIEECNIEFGLKVKKLLDRENIISGYENVAGIRFEMLRKIIEEIDSPRFGLCLDVGHCYLAPDAKPLKILDSLNHKIVEIHLYGTYHRPDRGFETHQPLEMEDCMDFEKFFSILKSKNVKSPLILEILAPSIRSYMEFCVSAKKCILKRWKD